MLCPAVRPCRQWRRLFSTARSSTVELSHQVIEPPTSQPWGRDGYPIIFMHGLFGSKRNNRSISKALARDLNRDIFIVDLRNHGDTQHAPDHTYDHMAEDVIEFVRQHQLGKAVLIGHSMGAKTAMTVALRHSDRVSGLIPVDNAPISARLASDFPKYVEGMKRIESANVTKQSEADEILQNYEESLPIRQFLLTNLIRGSNGNTLKFRVPLSILGPALDNMGRFPFNHETDTNIKYDGPTLFIRGSKSKYVPDSTMPAIKTFFPNVRVVDIEAGHWVISEKPEDFRRAVISFFKENEVE